MKPAPEPDQPVTLPAPSSPSVAGSSNGDVPGHSIAEPAELKAVEAPQYKWYHKLAGLFAVIFCFELGVFLLVFPWASDWDLNYFSSLPLWASTIWASPYFRGAISGLGVLNIYVSFIEVFRLRRFSASSSSLS
jgi:hypothetical protein